MNTQLVRSPGSRRSSRSGSWVRSDPLDRHMDVGRVPGRVWPVPRIPILAKESAAIQPVPATSLPTCRRPSVYDPALLDRTLENNRLVESLIRTEVENELRQARARMAANPQSIQETLKLTLERVRKAPRNCRPRCRAQLQGQLETALRESARRTVEKGPSATSNSNKHKPRH